MLDLEVIHPKIWELSQDDVTIFHALRLYSHGLFTGYLDMLEHLVIQLEAEKNFFFQEALRLRKLLGHPMILVPVEKK